MRFQNQGNEDEIQCAAVAHRSSDRYLKSEIATPKRRELVEGGWIVGWISYFGCEGWMRRGLFRS
jgi:hypothetical protein